jgi:hypothetical protein
MLKCSTPEYILKVDFIDGTPEPSAEETAL